MLQFFAQHSKLIDQIGINALLALSLSISLRAGQLALSQVAFMGIAGYISAIGAVKLGWNWPLGALAGALAAAAIAALLALPIGRLRGVFLAIATVGFGEIARVVEINARVTGGAEGFSGIPNDAGTGWIYGTLAVVGVAFVLFGKTKAALAIAAAREDESAARSVGIWVAAVRLSTLVAGAFVAGLAGALYAHSNFFITPGDFGFGRMESVLVACVIGGVTSSIGAVLGATLVTLLPELTRALQAATGAHVDFFREIATGLVLLGVIVFAPSGISGLWKKRT